MVKLESLFTTLNRKVERSEGAILTGLNRTPNSTKLYHEDVGNHKAIQALKMFDSDR